MMDDKISIKNIPDVLSNASDYMLVQYELKDCLISDLKSILPLEEMMERTYQELLRQRDSLAECVQIQKSATYENNEVLGAMQNALNACDERIVGLKKYSELYSTMKHEAYKITEALNERTAQSAGLVSKVQQIVEKIIQADE